MTTQAKRTLLELTAILDNASVAIVFTQEGVVQRCNRRTAEIFGYPSPVDLSGKPAGMLHPDAESDRRLARESGPLLEAGKYFHGEWLLRRADGRAVWCNLYGKALDPANPGQGAVWIIEDVTEARRMAEAQRRTAREMEAIMKNAPVGVFFTRDRRLVRYNAKVAEIIGFRGDDGVGMPTRIFFRTDDEYEDLGREVGELLAQGRAFQKEVYLRRMDGEDVWVNLVAYVQNVDDTREGTIWLIEDRTAVLRAEQAVRRASAEQRRTLHEMEAIMTNASIGIVLTRDRKMVRYNARFAEMYGFEGNEGVGAPGRTIYRSDEEYEALGRLAGPLLSQGKAVQTELFMRRRDGADLWVNLRGYVQDPQNPRDGTVWLLEDRTAVKIAEDALKRSRDELEVRVKERTAELVAEINHRRRAEERLRYLALHDGLTGLANRNLLRQRMAKAVEEVMARRQMGAVLFIDIDRFKNVNDTLGHRVGDDLLKVVAERISGAVRSGDIVSRLGGDEFVVVAFSVEQREHACRIAQKIHDSLQRPVRVREHELFATPSIGIALFPRDGTSPDLLIQNADAAMYQAKSSGRNAICFFDPAMTASAERYLRTESSLRRAIERGELETWYQPIVDLKSGACEALELLVRWRHPELGLVQPAEFMAVAEDSGLVARVGEVVLESACRQYAAWRGSGIEVPRLALNLSAQQFRDPRHTEVIASMLAAHAIAPSQVELEITETSLMQDGEQTLAILQSLAGAGFQLAVDDFGTGYSSLAYLKRFPVAKLKIDRSFIQDMTRDPNDEAIVRMIIALARTLRIATVAEGVEDAAQRDALKRLGCDFAQGYFYARPACAAEVEATWLAPPGEYAARRSS